MSIGERRGVDPALMSLLDDLAASWTDVRYVVRPGDGVRTPELLVAVPDDAEWSVAADADPEGVLGDLLAQAPPADEAGPARLTARWTTVAGQRRWAEHRCRTVRGPDGTTTLVGAARDVTDAVLERDALAESAARYRLLAENSGDYVLQVDAASGRTVWASPAVPDMLGWSVEDVLSQSALGLIHPDDHGWVREEMMALGDGDVVRGRSRTRAADGSYHWLDWHAAGVLDDAGALCRIVTFRDAQAEMETLAALETSENRFRTAMASAPVGMAVVSLERGFVEVNAALCRLLDRDEEWLLSHRITDVLDDEAVQVDEEMRAEVAGESTPASVREHPMLRADGTSVWVQHSIGLLRAPDGRAISYVCQFVDVTDARRARNLLVRMATRDSLTDLLNRRELVSRVGELLARRSRSGGTGLAVFFIDLDRLKQINDSRGHAAGDAVIRAVADRLRARVRADDLVARIGGDEFVVALPNVHDIDEAAALAENVHAAVSRPVDVDGEPVPAGLSIGVALARPGDDLDTVLSRADAALYEAKSDGRGRVAVERP